jgi:uncharacterized protein
VDIIDGHTHIASTHFTPHAFLDGVFDNVMEQMRLSPFQVPRNKVMDQLLSHYQDHDGSGQVQEMDRLGIKKSIVLLPDFTYALKGTPMSIDQMYAAHRDILARHAGRMEVFAGPDPRWGKDGFDLFVKGVEEYGFRGLKIYPPCGYSPSSDILKPYYEYCQEFRLPVIMHVGPTSPVLSFSEATPMQLDAAARKYTDVPFILAHGAANYREDCINLCKYRPNVYLDLSGAQQIALDASRVSEFMTVLTSGITHKVIFGTDWPINYHSKINGKYIDMMRGKSEATARLSSTESGLLLNGNINHILSMSRKLRAAANSETAQSAAV